MGGPAKVQGDGVRRRDFLRQAGRTLAAGVGIVLATSAVASADPDVDCCSCCRSDTCPTCSGPKVRYSCSCGGSQCCICHTGVGMCFGSGNTCYC